MSIVGEKSKAFAVRIIRLYQYLQRNKNEYEMSRQLLRSGTSIGANIAESEYAISRNDFQAKLYISLKETSDMICWLDILREAGYITQRQYESIHRDASELLKMLSSATKTIRESRETPHS